jgi:hypothetical protein
MPSKTKIAIAVLAFAMVGVLATDALAHKRPKHGTHQHRPPHLPTISQRLGGLVVDPTISGTWTPLAHGFPGLSAPSVPAADQGPDTMLLLTDGSVIVHDICTPNWHRLIPDQFGSYINGNWSTATVGDDNAGLAPLAAMPGGYGPLFYASQVLPDSRVIVQGGEDEAHGANGCGPTGVPPNTLESALGALYNPHTNTWSAVGAPPGFTQVGDASSILLTPNNITGSYSQSSYMVADCCDGGVQARQQAVATIPAFPATAPITWTITGCTTLPAPCSKIDANSEEGWVILPNGFLLTVDTGCLNTGPAPAFQCLTLPTSAELFNQSTNKWFAAGNTPTTLTLEICNSPPPIVLCFVPEIGAGVSIGSNMAVWFGGNSNTAVFTYPGTWTAGPVFPNGQEQADGPAAILPNGNILVQTSNAFTVDNNGNLTNSGAPSLFWEFSTAGLTPLNPGGGTLTPVANPTPCNDAANTNVPAFQSRMLVLPATADAPNGQVLWDAGEGVNCTSVYRPNAGDGTPNRLIRPAPHISSISTTTLSRGGTNFTLAGSLFRDVSQGATYGDNAQMATNYPMVRITNNTSGRVCWGRTHNWAIQNSTQFDVPPDNTGSGGNADWALVVNTCDTVAGGGASTLVLIVNGLVSNPIAVTVN